MVHDCEYEIIVRNLSIYIALAPNHMNMQALHSRTHPIGLKTTDSTENLQNYQHLVINFVPAHPTVFVMRLAAWPMGNSPSNYTKLPPDWVSEPVWH